jgi:hypothetical protein
MRMHLLNWLRGVSVEGAVSRTGALAPLVPEVVSGVSRPGAAQRLAGSLAMVGLGLWVTSCAEPKLDGLPEDPGEHVPLPTIGPPQAGSDIGDAGTLPSDDGDDASAGEGTQTNEVDPGGADAGASPSDSPGTESRDVSSDESAPVSTSGAASSTAAGSNSSSSTATTQTASGSGTGDGTTGASSGSESPDTTDTSATSDSTDETTGTDYTDTTAVEADAGGYYPYDGGATSDDSTDESSVEVDAGDAGDAGMDGGGEL